MPVCDTSSNLGGTTQKQQRSDPMRTRIEQDAIPDDVPPVKMIRIDQNQVIKFGDILHQLITADTPETRDALIREGMARVELINNLQIMQEDEDRINAANGQQLLMPRAPDEIIPILMPSSTDPLANITPPTKVTLGCTVNLGNYENIKLDVEAKNVESCIFGMSYSLAKLGKGNEVTKDIVDHYIGRVLKS